jgi:hypothetical protein
MTDNDMNTKWKDRLLSSSVPLEYEVAKILTKENFFVDYDFAYQRFDEKEEKEFSVDISATGFYPFRDSNKIDIQIDLLVECKYRNPDVKWAFLPILDPDTDLGVTSGEPVKFIDDFSEVRFKSTWNLLEIPNSCNKGIEINILNGEVHDTGIHHGVNQLIYSLPIVLRRSIKDSLENHLDDVFPFAFCPILVTTAELRLLNVDFSIDSVKNADSLDNLSIEVPYLVYHTDLYPSFTKHCENLFKNIPNEEDLERFEYFNELRSMMITSIDGEKNVDPNIRFYETENLMNILKHGNGRGYFNEILICNLIHLPELIKRIKEVINIVGSGIEKIEKKL